MSNNKAFKVKNGLDLGEYSKAISDTAVDIFVYDTSKDSDGGAWRKRTQGTSWYNETLNTATRGSRKEFPAVAVIVADNSTNPRLITIYDGDDPDLPMWMVFKVINGNMLGEGDVQAVSALNGIISVACGGSGYDFYTANMVEDAGYQWFNASTTRFYSNVGNRNVSASATDVNASFITISNVGLASRKCNDVAMTVLPNAPIDAATGLPVPTIAVATDGGVSVIKDDGTVVDSSDTSAMTSVEFTSDSRILYTRQGSLSNVANTFEADGFGDHNIYSYAQTTNPVSAGGPLVTTADRDFIHGSGARLSRMTFEEGKQPYGKVAWITSDYNTGWMNGDIKLATLSDTDDTDVTGSELVTNGTFDSNITGWTASNSQAQIAHDTGGDGGRLKFTANGANNARIKGTLTTALVSGKTYTLSYNAQSTVPSKTLRLYMNTVDNISGGQTLQNTDTTDVGDGVVRYSYTFTASSNHTMILFETNGYGHGSNYIWYIDDVSVRLAEEDRSVNGNGLQVFGTVTKNPVATGADLVAYSGWSDSNYVEQPYNSDLDFGTGDFVYMGWLTPATVGTYRWLITYGDGDRASGNRGFGIRSVTSASAMEIRITGNTISFTIPSSGWVCVAVVRQNGIAKVYVNGVEAASGSASGDVTISDATMRIGYGSNHSFQSVASISGWTGSAALWRISATAPSPEQIKKIYDTEKFLFQDGAQATLYGSSDAVTALAYDDSTNLLHVGTSAGRSVFQGLRRVDNTTTAVGAAISASNGLVADE